MRTLLLLLANENSIAPYSQTAYVFFISKYMSYVKNKLAKQV